MPAAHMLTVSLPIEILRTRPQLIFWLATLSQAVLWVMVPTLFYSAPPGELAEVLAVGHAFKFGSELGPPLAHWLAEIALRAAGGHMIGVYLLSQICIVAPIGRCSSSDAKPSAIGTRCWRCC